MNIPTNSVYMLLSSLTIINSQMNLCISLEYNNKNYPLQAYFIILISHSKYWLVLILY